MGSLVWHGENKSYRVPKINQMIAAQEKYVRNARELDYQPQD